MYPSKNVNLCLFYASEEAKVLKKANGCVSHLSHSGGGGGWVALGGGGTATKQGESPFTAKMRPFI
jgi:hypothetical protein